jgi:hypothetical protein
MTPILDRIAAQARQFLPSSPEDFLALRLATRLGEPQSAAHFALLASQNPAEMLIGVFHRTLSSTQPTEDLGRAFHRELARHRPNGEHLPLSRLVAIRIERRCVATAVFTGRRLDAVRVRQLASDPVKAELSTAGFVRSIVGEFEIESAVLEHVSCPEDVQRTVLARAVSHQLRESAVSLMEVDRRRVAAAFGHPPLVTRQDVRDAVLRIWPQLTPRRGQLCVLDAAAMGLFVQTEHLFSLN